VALVCVLRAVSIVRHFIGKKAKDGTRKNRSAVEEEEEGKEKGGRREGRKRHETRTVYIGTSGCG
jgi:hypothetical protein